MWPSASKLSRFMAVTMTGRGALGANLVDEVGHQGVGISPGNSGPFFWSLWANWTKK